MFVLPPESGKTGFSCHAEHGDFISVDAIENQNQEVT